MVDEPSNGELARRLDKIEVLLQGLVSRAEYTNDQRHMEHRFSELERDISEVRVVHQEDKKDANKRFDQVNKRMDDEGQSRGSNLRQAVYTGVIPGIFLAISLLVTILLAFKGSK